MDHWPFGPVGAWVGVEYSGVRSAAAALCCSTISESRCVRKMGSRRDVSVPNADSAEQSKDAGPHQPQPVQALVCVSTAVCTQVLMDEESAFWMLDVICEDLCPAYYTRDMRGAVIDQQILSDLVRRAFWAEYTVDAPAGLRADECSARPLCRAMGCSQATSELPRLEAKIRSW